MPLPFSVRPAPLGFFLGVTLSLVLAAAALPAAAADTPAPDGDAASPVGLWKTIDDHTGKARALIRIYEQAGKLYGKIVKGLDPEPAGAKAEPDVCSACTDERKNAPMKGLVIIRNLTRDGDAWDGGDILDPDSGTIYGCRIKLGPDGHTLEVRGFLGFSFLGRSQVWQRADAGALSSN